jgi:hypothetical protein
MYSIALSEPTGGLGGVGKVVDCHRFFFDSQGAT